MYVDFAALSTFILILKKKKKSKRTKEKTKTAPFIVICNAPQSNFFFLIIFCSNIINDDCLHYELQIILKKNKKNKKIENDADAETE